MLSLGCLIVTAIAKWIDPKINSSVFYWQGESVFFCILWAVLRRCRPNLTPLLLFAYLIFDHTLYCLAYAKKLEWYIPEKDLELYVDRMNYHLFCLMLLNYNSFKLSVAICPVLFLVPEYFE